MCWLRLRRVAGLRSGCDGMRASRTQSATIEIEAVKCRESFEAYAAKAEYLFH